MPHYYHSTCVSLVAGLVQTRNRWLVLRYFTRVQPFTKHTPQVRQIGKLFQHKKFIADWNSHNLGICYIVVNVVVFKRVR